MKKECKSCSPKDRGECRDCQGTGYVAEVVDEWQPFCKNTGPTRYHLDKPFHKDGYKVATDGVMMVFRKDGAADTPGIVVPDVKQLIDKHPGNHECVLWMRVSRHKIPCENCFNEGYLMEGCDDCFKSGTNKCKTDCDAVRRYRHIPCMYCRRDTLVAPQCRNMKVDLNQTVCELNGVEPDGVYFNGYKLALLMAHLPGLGYSKKILNISGHHCLCMDYEDGSAMLMEWRINR